MLSTRHAAATPGIVIHGEVEIPDLEALTGFGAPFGSNSDKPTGRWESTRDVADLRRPSSGQPAGKLSLRAVDLRHASDLGVYCSVFSEPSFKGNRKDFGTVARSNDVGFDIRSVRTFYVKAGGGGG